ncbi:unnamed protein product [Clonostachys rhizophaga]|uniref:Uncharacterized protein n=1 Tax=Clonostachys rhizophaga TaxID=160324 RepID=A0A9N9VT27_9HYPO|nr:unnamed protein product [Clonostachys rhizophaga]
MDGYQNGGVSSQQLRIAICGTANRLTEQTHDTGLRDLHDVVRECMEDAREATRPEEGDYVGLFVGFSEKDTEKQGSGETEPINYLAKELGIQGPSMAIMSEFSSGLIALHEACYAISMGMATSAIVACAEPPLLTTSVEQDAISVLYLKPLHAARRDGNPVRAVIRAAETDYYSSFHEAELPTERMYETLIRRAYEKAGLDPGHTINVQQTVAPSTAVAEPEKVALQSVFGLERITTDRQKDQPAIGIGMAGLFKAIDWLIRNSPSQNLNGSSPSSPQNDEDLSKQVGVNSFGPRGFNVHAVLESHPAASRSSGEPQHDSSPERFSMISPDNVSDILRHARSQCQLLGDYKIEDIYPCTPLQESFMAMGEEQPGSYFHRWVYKLPSGIRSDRLREAWDVVIEQNSILRSRIILFHDQALQVVIADDISWEKPATNLSVHAYVNQVRSLNMTYGSRLNRYAIIQEDDGSSYFIWIAHHAMFDTSSMQTILDSLHRAYHGSDLGSSVPYTNFIRYTQSLNAEAARSYWRNELEGAIRSQYPHSSPTKTSKLSVRRKRISMSFRGGTESCFKQSTILYAAWAMVLSQYCDSSDVCFGTAITGGETSAFGLSDVSGPTTAEIPIRLLVDAKQSVSEFLECVQSKVSGADAFEQFGLQNIAKVSQDAKEACNFSNVMVMQPENCSSMAALTEEDAVLHHERDQIELSEESLNNYFKYPLVMHPSLENDQFQMDFVYHSDLVSETQLEGIYYHMEHVMKQLVRPIDCHLGEIQVSGPWDISFACNTNQEKPEVVDRCIHEMFEQRVELGGERVAIDAWDLTLTYRELNCSANRLAHRLKNRHGIKPGDLVHVCFEKSAWFFISVLAANKAGAGWVPLDPSHPLERLEKLVSQSKAAIALSSPNNVSICTKLMGESVLEVSQSLDEELKASESSANGCAAVSPDEVAYVIFTSGTTGMPKGVVIQHKALCTSQTDWVRKSGLSPEDRLLQFSSYVFDMVIGETFASLINGTCVCVPSEEDRLNRLADYIQEKSVTWLFQTPSVLQTLDPNDVPGLRTLVVGGEAISQDLVEQWFGKVRLFGAWGPTEACCIAALNEFTAPHESSKCLGRPIGGHNWLVDPSDASRLAPIGAIGEVVIQSPALLKEYLHDKVKTESSIVQSLPSWVPYSSSAHWSRWYKTGDLCRYNPDGTFDYVSRKDTQVKINGMRVEVEEIERNIRDHLHDVCQVVVDIIRTQAGLNVVAYLCFTDARKSGSFSATDIFELPSEENDTLAAGLVTKLGVKLPSYMIPTCFLHCRFMAINSSLKADRKRLKQLVSELDRSAISRYSRINTKKIMPETKMERSLQVLWAQVLQLAQESIGRDDGFLEIGGDSISAIKLISACRKKGIGLLTKDVLDSPSLSSVATKAVYLEQGTSTKPLPIRPFSLLGQEAIRKVQSEEIRELCGFSEDQLIEDAFPCSSMQEGLMAVSVRQPGSYVTKFVFKIPEYVDIDLMKASWENAVLQCPNMRSRIVLVDGESIQLVVKENTAWEHDTATDPATYISQQNFEYMGYGTSLSKNTILSCQNDIYFVWMAHHTFHDGWSVNILFDIFEKTYLGSKLDPLAEYPLFIKYTREIDGVAAGEYWAQKLKGSKRMTFPPHSHKSSRDPRMHSHLINLKGSLRGTITNSSIIRAAWALVIGRYEDTSDVCFGATVSGRQAPVPGIDSMPGPTIATVPVRYYLDHSEKISTFLHAVQKDGLDTVPHEQAGLQNISKLGEDAQAATDFRTLLVIQPTIKKSDRESGGQSVLLEGSEEREIRHESMGNYFEYPLVLVSNVYEDQIDQRFFYDRNVISDERIVAISNHLDYAVQQLLTKPDEYLLGDVSLVSSWDLQHAVNSQKLCESTRSCTHWLIKEQIEARPSDLAVAAWDGDMTYKQLGLYSARLAVKLQTLGVGPEVLVPFCFPKSVWAIVTMVAIQMAGGAFVPLDPAAPITRLQNIVKGTSASLVIGPPSNRQVLDALQSRVLLVDKDTILELPDPAQPVSCATQPENASFVIFTSGSTGAPKGIVIQHDQVCTSFCSGYAEKLGVGPGTRVFQFAAYTFDMGIFDVMGSLSQGACICVPTDHDRLYDLAASIRSFKANYLSCTPTVANLLHPDEVPLLKMVVLVGEVITMKTSNRWKDHVHLIGLYGPAEGNCCAHNNLVGENGRPFDIGIPLASALWVVNPENIKELVPVGCVGELLIQGPMLARGYINVSAEQASNWIERVDWLPGGELSHRRAYKTGDLVRRNADGTYDYLGRKDTQVKIRGQRVELGEIESLMYNFLPKEMSAIVEIVRREGEDLTDLFALIWYTDSSEAITQGPARLLDLVSPETQSLISSLNNSLERLLPSYAMPSSYLVLQGTPSTTTSGKVDRKSLAALAASVSPQDRLRFSPEVLKSEPPTTEMEFKLRDLWSQILGINSEDIGKYDSFLRLGGDSINAIKLVSVARQRGLLIDASAIFREPQLASMSERITQADKPFATNIGPFGMVSSIQTERLLSEIQIGCGLSSSSLVQDAYPCTKLQEGLMALTLRKPGSYIARHMFKLAPEVDLIRFRAALQKTAEVCTNLRTRIIEIGNVAVQAIIKDDFHWEVFQENMDLKGMVKATNDIKMTYGSALNHYRVARDGKGNRYFLWLSHHTTFDGWTLRVVMSALAQLYQNSLALTDARPYAEFISYTLSINDKAAESFWTKELEDARGSPFPSNHHSASGSSKIYTRPISLPKLRSSSITKATVLRAAWAIMLTRYSGTDDAMFGATVSGRSAPIEGVENISGAMIATVPVYVKLRQDVSVNEFLIQIQNQAADMMAYEQFGLQRISKINENTKEACNFSSLIVVQTGETSGHISSDQILVPVSSDEVVNDWLEGYFTYPLVMESILLDDDKIEISLTYDTTCLHHAQIEAMSCHFEQVASELIRDSEKLVKDITMTSPWDVKTAIARNPSPVISDTCVHHIVEEHGRNRPDSPAVYAWDGQLTYSELNKAANRLAMYLINVYKVKVGDVVHVCFDKSMWYFVAILAINKAGAAFAPIDPAHPKQRKQYMVQKTGSTVMLVSAEHATMSQEIAQHVIVVSASLDASIDTSECPKTAVTPNDVAYILFTSGTTGVPKGYVMEHRSVHTSHRPITEVTKVNSESRILQFSNFVFDFSTGEIFQSFMNGSCICVPSEEARLNNIQAFIREAHVDTLLISPAFARTLKPEDVPSVKLLGLGGEQVPHDLLKIWFGKVRLINMYGPGEICFACAFHEYQSVDDSPATIGHAVGSSCWVVDPNNHKQLAPIGTVGEILIQSPSVIREYLADEAKTKATIIDDSLPWTSNVHRSFKSGDLAFYNADGALEFVSRKDTQVKIRGLRVELGEIEQNIMSLLNGVAQVVVDVYRAEEAVHLVAFFSFSESRQMLDSGGLVLQSMFSVITPEVHQMLQQLVGKLRIVLPKYMIPTMYIPCTFMPIGHSSKLDRNALQASTKELSREQLHLYSLVSSKKRAPETEMEIRLQNLWSSILKIPAESIGRDDSFIQIGGDSISAIHLVNAAREQGIGLTVKSIFDDPRLLMVAASAIEITPDEEECADIQPFSLLPGSLQGDWELHLTAFQEGLMALAVKQPGSYIARWIYKLADSTNIDLFQAAWDRTVHICSNFRTRIVNVSGTTLQLVIQDDTTWERTEGMELTDFVQKMKDLKMSLGSRLNRWALVKESTGDCYFVLVTHHATYDGWSLQLALRTLAQSYFQTGQVNIKPFDYFVRHMLRLDREAAKAFWLAQLEGAQRAVFPPIKHGYESKTTSVMAKTIDLPPSTHDSITNATIMRAAWALVLAKYCDADDVCFGTSISGRQAAVSGISDISGPVVTTVPVRIRVNPVQQASEFLRDVQQQAVEIFEYEQYGLQNILKLGDSIRDACNFSSLLAVQPSEKMAEMGSMAQSIFSSSGDKQASGSLEGYFSYPLVVQTIISDTLIQLHVSYDINIVGEHKVTALTNHLEHTIKSLVSDGDQRLNQISIAGRWDLELAMKFNSEVPEIVEDTLHSRLSKQAREQPDAVAIQSGDATLTFKELDTGADNLAGHLVTAFEVHRGDLVHVLFEKTIWYFIAILAINKAGAAWVPLDPSHPVQRHRQVLSQTQSKLILASPQHAGLAAQLLGQVLQIDRQLISALEQSHPDVNILHGIAGPSDIAYVLFTSGSTGVPKGFVMQHRALCTSQRAVQKRIGPRPGIKVLQFASFVFDFFIGETVDSLMAGATICIPSDDIRMNSLVDFIRRTEANWLFLTPSFARTINPESVPSVELLILGGEAVGRDLFETWVGKTRVINAWGPAEACCFGSMHEWTSLDESPLTIGKPIGGHCWIVDPDDHHKLAPVGTLGEVVIQGPTLLREYLRDPERTGEAVSCDIPRWMPNADKPHWGRFYKTGDLCYLNDQGLLEFYSRKDTQVKIRGLRIELGEVEHQILTNMPGVRQIAVDVFRNATGAHLCAYLCSTMANNIEKPRDDELFQPLDTDTKTDYFVLSKKLRTILPPYMVPTFFISCSYMPFITTSKLDRKRLRAETEKLTQVKMAQYALQDVQKRVPETSTEILLQQIWADVLQVSTESIGRDDSFLAIGGDSITAISVVTAARDRGFSLKVDNIFRSPQLHELALQTSRITEPEAEAIQVRPFELLTENERELVIGGSIHKQYNWPADYKIEDAYPCSPLQEGLIALAEKQIGSYITKYVFRISKSICLQRFKTAWENTVQLNGNLRTRIVASPDRSIQVLSTNDMCWEDTKGLSLPAFLKATQKYEMTFGSRLNRFAIITNPDGTAYFSWIAHHSVLDGGCVNLNFTTLYNSYWNRAPVQISPFSGFIKYILNLDFQLATEFWREQLEGATRPSFPQAAVYEAKPTFKYLRYEIATPKVAGNTITVANMLRAAWSIVMARHCNSDDICFGATLSGRNASVPGLRNMPGPSITTIPVRIQLDFESTVQDFLDSVQNQATDMTPFEQFGLQNISKISESAREACQFPTLMVLRPQQLFEIATDESILEFGKDTEYIDQEMENYFNYPLLFEADFSQDLAKVRIGYNVDVISSTMAEAISHQVDCVVQQLISRSSFQKLSTISMVGTWDKEHAVRHQNMKPSTDLCIHDMIQQQMQRTPDLQAIVSWDGDMTYSEVEHYSTLLAGKLQSLGVGPEVFVPICFPKSIWAVITMIAVNMAGGAFVPLDFSAPVPRLKSILQDTNATLVLAGDSCLEVASSLDVPMYCIDRNFIDKLPRSPVASLAKYTNASFVMFTSGSTGKPKGMVFEHRNTCSTSTSHGTIQGWGPGTRVFSYSAYTFDIGVIDVMVSLSRGACLCIPSEWQRYNDIHGAINTLKANWTFLTPTLATLVKPAEIPTIKNVGLGGENVTKQVVDNWRGYATLHNLYGPAEASICGWIADVGIISKPNNIGVPSSCAWWVVDPNDHRQLIPVGCIGELMIQGPMMARGYIGVDEQTNQAWLPNADWLPGDAGAEKAYLTGDLVRRLEDGTFEYLGRKDTQVKLHGQRVELGEIEMRLSENLPRDMGCIVDTVVNEDQSNTLVALMWYTEGPQSVAEKLGVLENVSDGMRKLINNLESSLSETLPTYMVPSIYLIFQGGPERKSSGKIDRRKLCSVVKDISVKDRLRFSPVKGTNDQPETDNEHKLRDLWSQVLHVDANDIGRHDNFLRAGGDSISAIRLVTLAQEIGLSLDVGTIFRDPRLSAMAATLQGGSIQTEKDPERFSLLANHFPVSMAVPEAAKQCKMRNFRQIEDMYPCTPFQSGLIALTMKQPKSYIAKHDFPLSSKIDIGLFKESWERTVQACANLRSRIVQVQGTDLLVVTKDNVTWENTSLDVISMTYGSPLNRFVLRQDQEGAYHFTWFVHHSVFDGWTIRLVMDTFYRIYRNEKLPNVRPYSSFIAYTLQTNDEANKNFWEKQLQGAQRASFPPKPSGASQRTRVFQKCLSISESQRTSVTRATAIRAAWAILLAQYCRTEDVTFAATVAGRNAPVAGIENIPGTMITTVPVRIHLDRQKTIHEFLESVQSQAIEMIAYEQYGLSNIAKVSSDAREACDCSSLTVVQPVQRLDYTQSDNEELMLPVNEDVNNEDWLQGYFTYPLVMQGALDEDKIELYLIYNTEVLQSAQIEAIYHQFEQILSELLTDNKHKLLSDICMASPWDLQIATSRNPKPEVFDACIHDIIDCHAKQNPNSPAIHAWDGTLSYRELADASDRFAQHLIDTYNIQVGDVVHVCIEKSKWYFVAILAINKTGAAFSPLDPEHPFERRKTIVEKTKSKLMIVSATHASVSTNLVQNILELTPDLDCQLSRLDREFKGPLRPVTPADMAYVLFTSGSTGMPKGFVLEHRALSSAQQTICKRVGISAEARILQFANFVFDFSIGEIFMALFSGACVCVPSEEARFNGAAVFIQQARVSHAFVSPSFALTLTPEQVPSLKILFLAGEAVPQHLLSQWYGKVRLFNGWGPGETCVASSLYEYATPNDLSDTIGTSMGAACWIVDPENPNQLAPIGTVGEILIQGPTVLREYLANEEKSKETIITDLPSWVPHRETPRMDRAFLSGDLACYKPDGMMQFISRKGTQIKIRGLRVELGEIENNILAASKGIAQVAVDVLDNPRTSSKEIVAYFSDSESRKLCTNQEINAEDMFHTISEQRKSQLLELVGTLKLRLPAYMIPSIFIPCTFFPVGISSKLDRKTLKTCASALSEEQRQHYSLVDAEKRPPQTPMETRMQALWGSILNRSIDSIGRDDSFLQIGGDSIIAIRLVATAREAGIELTVQTIFKDPRLFMVAAAAILVVGNEGSI